MKFNFSDQENEFNTLKLKIMEVIVHNERILEKELDGRNWFILILPVVNNAFFLTFLFVFFLLSFIDNWWWEYGISTGLGVVLGVVSFLYMIVSELYAVRKLKYYGSSLKNLKNLQKIKKRLSDYVNDSNTISQKYREPISSVQSEIDVSKPFASFVHVLNNGHKLNRQIEKRVLWIKSILYFSVCLVNCITFIFYNNCDLLDIIASTSLFYFYLSVIINVVLTVIIEGIYILGVVFGWITANNGKEEWLPIAAMFPLILAGWGLVAQL